MQISSRTNTTRPCLITLCLAMAVSACGGSSGSGSTGNAVSGEITPWDQGGTIMMSEASRASGNIQSIIEVPFGPDRQAARPAFGTSPWQHQDGTLYYVSNCGSQSSYIATLDAAGGMSSATPCSDTIVRADQFSTDFTYVMASPDQRRIAVEGRWVDRSFNTRFDTLIYEDGNIIARYEGHYAASWLDNDTLILPSGNGLFTATIGGIPVPINTSITGAVNNPDVSPDGSQIVFEWNGDIWVLDSDGSDLRQVADDSTNLRYPVWSPNGEFIAFLRIEAPGPFDHILIAGDPLNLAHIANANESFVFFVRPATSERWLGTLERHMNSESMPQGQLSWLPPRL